MENILYSKDEADALTFSERNEAWRNESEILNLLTDVNENVRKKAGMSFSKVLNENLRTRALILNTISRDKYIEDKQRGFKNPISSRNIDNDVEDEVVEALASTVTNRFKSLSHRYYKLKSSWLGKDKLNTG